MTEDGGQKGKHPSSVVRPLSPEKATRPNGDGSGGSLDRRGGGRGADAPIEAESLCYQQRRTVRT